MKIHQLKIKPGFAYDILDNGKNFEVRLNDRNFQINDIIMFKVISEPEFDKDIDYLNEHFKNSFFKITYILNHCDFPLGIKDNYIVFAFRRTFKGFITSEVME